MFQTARLRIPHAVSDRLRQLLCTGHRRHRLEEVKTIFRKRMSMLPGTFRHSAGAADAVFLYQPWFKGYHGQFGAICWSPPASHSTHHVLDRRELKKSMVTRKERSELHTCARKTERNIREFRERSYQPRGIIGLTFLFLFMIIQISRL